MGLNAEHRADLLKSALSDQQISALGWSSLHDGGFEIPYLKPDGTPEECHDGSSFTRTRLSDAQIAELKRKGTT